MRESVHPQSIKCVIQRIIECAIGRKQNFASAPSAVQFLTYAILLNLAIQTFAIPTFAAPPDEAEALYQKAVLRGQKPDASPTALRDLNKALSLKPGNIKYLAERASVYLDLDEDAAAKRDLDSVLAISPKFPPALYLKARIELQENQLKQAMRDIDAALLPDPSHYVYNKLKVRIAVAQGNLPEAERLLDKQIAREPNFYVAYYEKGEILAKQHKWTNVINNVKTAMKLAPVRANPKSRALLLQSAAAHESLAQYKDAIQDYQQFLKLSPDNRMARAALLRIYEKLNDKASAVKERAALDALDSDAIGTPAERAKYENRYFPKN